MSDKKPTSMWDAVTHAMAAKDDPHGSNMLRRYGPVQPGSEEFDSLLKRTAHAMHKVGDAAYGLQGIYRRDLTNTPEDVLAAIQSLKEAHKLLLGAEAVLRSAHVRAKKK